MTRPRLKSLGWKWPGSRLKSVAPIKDPWPSSEDHVERIETPIDRMLSGIEAAACRVYARHGLPDRPGHYARSPRSKTWRFLSETLTAEERWAMIMAQKDGSKWTFGTLQDLGDKADSPPDLRQAAQVLRSCHQLRARLGEGVSNLGEDLETAIALGRVWGQIDVAPTQAVQRSEPLKLTMPDKTRAPKKPAAKPSARRKS